MADKLELALLGTPEIHLAGQPLARFRSSKTYALFYYLAVTRRAQPRTVLAGLFWGDVGEYYARRNFNRTLSDLSQFVGDHLEIERQRVAFARTQPYWLDVESLESAATIVPTPQTIPTLTAAIDLYRGDFLDGFYVQESPEFEQWVLNERTRLRTSVLQLLDTLSHYYAEQGDLTQAMQAARRILQLEPWREEAHRHLMQLLAQSGQRSAALAQYELCRQALQSELAVEPDAATLELVARIRAGEFTPPMPDKSSPPPPPAPVHPVTPPKGYPPPHNLTGQRTPFVGRTLELGEIMRLLVEDEECRLLTVIGPGGMGKTRVAIKAAEQIVASASQPARFADGIFLVSLENVGDANGLVSAVISVIAEVIGFPLQGEAPLTEQLLSFLRTKAMLLLLDNFEHLLAEAVLLSDLLLAAPRVKLLVSSRETLGLQEAWLYPLEGLTIPTSPTQIDPQQEEYDAVRLFAQSARRTRPNFDLAAERAAVLRICTLVEGMPLGIELAAAWLKVMSCEQIAQEVAHGLDFLTTRYQNIPPRHRSMRTVMEHAWALLGAEEAAAIARLSIFRGRFRQESATVITGTSLFTLADLVEKALVRTTADGFYQLHELTRQYAEEKLGDLAKRLLLEAHASYYANLLAEQRPHLFSAAYRQVWAMMGGELDNIRHAWQWIVHAIATGRSDLPVAGMLRQMAEVFANYYLTQSLALAGQSLFVSACQACETAGWATSDGSDLSDASLTMAQNPQATLLHLRLINGLFHFERGHYRASLEIAEDALVHCRRLGIEEDLLLALLLYGRTQMRRGVFDEATTSLQEALTLAKRIGISHRMIEALISLGMVASAQGYYAQAQSDFQEALALCQQIGYRPWVGRVLTSLGTTHSRQHHYQQAQPYFEQALAIAQEEGMQNQVMILTSNLGWIQRGFAHYLAALDYYQRSLAMSRNMGEERWIAVNLNGLATTYLEMRELTSAERRAREALTVGQQSGSITDTLGSISLLGHLFAQQGQVEKALKALLFVEQHPATMARDRLYNKSLLSELRSELPSTLFEEIETWAASQSLDEVVQGLNEIYALTAPIVMPRM